MKQPQTTLWKRIECFINGHKWHLNEDRFGVFMDGQARKVIQSWCSHCGKYQNASVPVSMEEVK